MPLARWISADSSTQPKQRNKVATTTKPRPRLCRTERAPRSRHRAAHISSVIPSRTKPSTHSSCVCTWVSTGELQETQGDEEGKRKAEALCPLFFLSKASNLLSLPLTWVQIVLETGIKIPCQKVCFNSQFWFISPHYSEVVVTRTGDSHTASTVKGGRVLALNTSFLFFSVFQSRVQLLK